MPRLVPIAAAFLLTAACTGDKGKKTGQLKSGDESAPVPVELATLETGPIEDTLRYSSTLRAEKQIQILSRTAGQVRERKVEEGDAVKAGQILARIEAIDQNLAVSRIDTDLAQARRGYERELAANKQGLSSTSALERAKFEVDRLELARREARRSLGHTVVRAPIAGTVTQRMIKYGDVVIPNQPLFEIVDFDSLVAEVFVPEKDVHKVKVSGAGRLSSASSGRSLPSGAVERIAPVVDPRSGTVKVTLDLPDTEGLRPGMFVDIHLVVAAEDSALLLPRRALVYDNDQPYAFKLVDRAGGAVVERIRVEPAIEDRDFVKPASSFAAGDRVVVAGQVGLKDGARVEVVERETDRATQAKSPKTPDAAPAK
jgi:membrane fusion protein (multidrug efflux system)